VNVKRRFVILMLHSTHSGVRRNPDLNQ